MIKIVFVNDSTPALNATNLNQLQDNVEDAIDNVIQAGTSLPATVVNGQVFLLYSEE